MKKIVLSLLIITCCWTAGQSQKAMLKLNLYTFIKYSDPEVYMEFNLNEKSSIDAALRLGIGSSPFSNQVHVNIDIRGAYRYYPLHKIFKTPIGLFLRPVVGYSSLPGGGLNQISTRRSSFQLGATGGFQYVFKKKVAIDLFIGEAYHISLSEDYGSGFKPVYNIGIGYGF